MTRPGLAKTYRSGYWGVAFGVETIHVTGFEGTQWFVQVGRKVWVFRPLTRGES